MGVCNQVTFLILYCIIYRLTPLLKVIDGPIHVPNVFDLPVSFKFLNFNSHICFLFFLKCLLTSRFTLFIISTLLLLGPVLQESSRGKENALCRSAQIEGKNFRMFSSELSARKELPHKCKSTFFQVKLF